MANAVVRLAIPYLYSENNDVSGEFFWKKVSQVFLDYFLEYFLFGSWLYLNYKIGLALDVYELLVGSDFAQP